MLDVRKNKVLEFTKAKLERQRAAPKTKYHWLGKIGGCLGYTVMVLVMMCLVIPPFVLTHIRNEVKRGEWGN